MFFSPKIIAPVLLPALLLAACGPAVLPETPAVDPGRAIASPTPTPAPLLTKTTRPQTPQATATYEARLPRPATETTASYITPPPPQTGNGSASVHEGLSPDGTWKARFTYTHLDEGGQHLLLEILTLEDDWKPVWTLWDEVEFGIGGSVPVLKGWDKDSRFFYFTTRHNAFSCAFFDIPDTIWKRADVLTGRTDDFVLPFGYEHALSPDSSTLAYIFHEPELALVIHDLNSQAEQQIPLPASEVGPGSTAAGGLLWSPDGRSLALAISTGDLCEGKPVFGLARINIISGQVVFLDITSRLVSPQIWDRSGKILLRDWDGASWWINAARGSITSAAPAPPTATPPPLSQPEIQATVVASSPVRVIEYARSPDGRWQAEVRSYDCVQTGPYDLNAFEELVLRGPNQMEIRAEEQFLNCGGVGAWGLGNLVWSPDSRYLYYSTARESVPDGFGICLWERPLIRLDVASGERLQLSYGVFSPGGDTWAMRQGHELVLWSYAQGELDRITSPKEGGVFLDAAWLPDESALIYTLGHSACDPFGPTSLGMVNLATRQHTTLVEDVPDLEFSLVQGGQAVLYRTAEGVGEGRRYYLHGLSLYYLDLGTRQPRLLAQASDMLFFRVGRDGRELVYWADDADPEHPRGLIRLAYINLDNMAEHPLAESADYIDYSMSAETGKLVYLERENRGGAGSHAYSLTLVDLDSLAQVPVLAGQGSANFSLSPDGLNMAVIEVQWEGPRQTGSKVSLVELVEGRVTTLFESSSPRFEYVNWEDNDTLALDWQGWRYHIPTGTLAPQEFIRP